MYRYGPVTKSKLFYRYTAKELWVADLLSRPFCVFSRPGAFGEASAQSARSTELGTNATLLADQILWAPVARSAQSNSMSKSVAFRTTRPRQIIPQNPESIWVSFFVVAERCARFGYVK